MPSCEALSETGIENFRIFLKFLADNNLIDDAASYLKSKGHERVRVSIEVIQDVQQFLREKYEAAGTMTPEAKIVIDSAHSHC